MAFPITLVLPGEEEGRSGIGNLLGTRKLPNPTMRVIVLSFSSSSSLAIQSLARQIVLLIEDNPSPSLGCYSCAPRAH